MDAVFLPEGVRALDQQLEHAGLLELAMEEAGRAGADAVQSHFPMGRVLLLCGSGANGGDGLVAARHLYVLGREVVVLAQPSKHPLTRSNRRRLRAVGVAVAPLTLPALRRELARADVVVDGLLGTGFVPPLRPALAELVTALNAAGRPVVALDLPSGLNAALAEVEGEPVRAQITVTFSGPKPALLYGPAAHWAGKVEVAPLRVPQKWRLTHAAATRPTAAEVAALLPVRPADAHKGTAGRVWVVGGSAGMVGAPLLSGLAALRTGAGLVTLYSETTLPQQIPELMIQTRPDLAATFADWPQKQRPDALCLGMGLGPRAPKLARLLLPWNIGTVLDADALQPELAGLGHTECIWTPHPAEAARLLGVGTPDITRDPLAAAQALQRKFGGVVVLKGGPSTIATPQELWVSRGGHAGMATAGMGDTLSGILAALLAGGLPAPQAALVGVTLHARAGEWAGRQHGYGLIASDVSAELGRAWQSLRDDLSLKE